MDETTYTNPNASDQQYGRTILGFYDLIVLIPRQPLTPGATYTWSIAASGRTYSGSFTVSAQARDCVDRPGCFY